MNLDIDEAIIEYCQNIGFSRDLIIQSWTFCQGNKENLLDTLYDLRRQTQMMEMIQGAKYPFIKRIPNSTLLKKLPGTRHLTLEFVGKTSLEYLELRKLGLFSKKTFRHIKALSLEYLPEGNRYLQNKHVSILANHPNRGLRKLRHLSIKLFTRWSREGTCMIPLLKSIKQNFVCLVSLKLALMGGFESSDEESLSLEKIFARMRSTLKHLHIDFSEKYLTERSFLENLGMTIMKHLRKLETLCLGFHNTSTSAIIIRLLIWGACTHLTCLRSLDIRVDCCFIDREDWKFSPNSNLRNNLQSLHLGLAGSAPLRPQCLTTLQNDIVTLCPKLEDLYICTLNCTRFSDQFYAILEKRFFERLNLKRLRLHYSDDLEEAWNAYQETQDSELGQAMQMEEEVGRVKQWGRGEEAVQCYYKTLMEEKQAPTKYEYSFGPNEYLENNLENQFFENEEIGEEEQDDLEQRAKEEYLEYTLENQFFEKEDLEPMAKEQGESASREKFLMEYYFCGVENDDYFDPLERWEMEEEILREWEIEEEERQGNEYQEGFI